MSANATVITTSAPSSTRFGTEPVGERPAEEAARERRRRLHGGRAAGEPERDPAHVVEVDEQEREDDAVPERVDERSELEHVDVPRQARVERAEIGVESGQAVNLARVRGEMRRQAGSRFDPSASTGRRRPDGRFTRGGDGVGGARRRPLLLPQRSLPRFCLRRSQ